MNQIPWSWNRQLISLSWVKINQLWRGKDFKNIYKGYVAKSVPIKKSVLDLFLLHYLTVI